MLDRIDRQLLAAIQEDSSVSVAEIATRVSLSVTPCWRRLQRLEKDGYVRARVALLDAKRLNLAVTAFMEIRVAQHSASWLEQFATRIAEIPEVIEVYRLSGHADYLLKVLVPDIAAYDGIYKRLISTLELSDVRSSFAMETMKWTSMLPLNYAT
jgi:Lrp/AsnC family transcriptional regulator